MINVIVHGALGRMGSIVVNMIEASEDMCVSGAVDAFSKGGAVSKSLEDVKRPADMMIDFSHHSLTEGLLDWAIKHGTPVVLCTTGHDEKEKNIIKAASERIPVFYSANMSMGIALLAELAKKTAALFSDADIEIVETHHNRKLDAPSGTALLLGNAIKQARPEAEFNMGRSGMAKREKDEIGFHAIRRGNIPGIHEVIVSTDNQSISLKHEVYDRALFAEGALAAARYLHKKPAGVYDMNTLIKE